MMYDYSKLIGKIIEVFGTRKAFADKMEMTEHTLSKKLTNQSTWTQPEMRRASELLDFPLSEIQVYFFTLKVQTA